MQETEQQIAEETPVTTKSYPFDLNPIKVQINTVPSLEKPSYTTHELRKPSFKEEAARERKMALETRDIGKVEGKDASSVTIDDEEANVELYDKLIQTVSGYGLGKDDKASDKLLPDTLVPTKNGEKAVRDLIPASHKSTAINGMFPSSFEVETSDGDFVFILGGAREWVVKQEIGGRNKQDDGTLSDPDFVIKYTFSEPSESDRKTFRNKAVNAVTLRDTKTQSIVDRRTTNLETMKTLFDSLIQNIEGATIGGKEVNVANKEQLEMIPATFKKGCIIRLFNFLESDLKN